MVIQPSNYDKVRTFHKAFGADLDKQISPKLLELRLDLIEEEHEEVKNECIYNHWPEYYVKDNVDRQKLAKELADLLYVTYGTAATFGIDIDRVFDEVHRSNMSKLGEDGKPVYRQDGKVLKGPNYTPPDLNFIHK